MSQELAGRVALVTGGAQGIGREICLSLAQRGATVVVNYLTSEEAARTLVQSLAGLSFAHRADVSDARQVQEMVSLAVSKLGKIDYLINNASFASPKLWKVSLETLDMEEWRNTVEVDLTGTLLCCKAVVPIMRREGYGKIVNFSSSASLQGDPDTLAYNPAKTAVVGLTKTLARMLAPEIRVNAIAPGSIEGGWVENWALTQADVDETLASILVRRFGAPREVAEAVAFLICETGDFITGQVWAIDGGVFL